MAKRASKIPPYLAVVDQEADLGTPAKVVQYIRDKLVPEQMDAAKDGDSATITGLYRVRETLGWLFDRYVDEEKLVANSELVQRVRELEALLASQGTGDALVSVAQDDPFGAGQGETAH